MAWMRDPDDGQVGEVLEENVPAATKSGLIQVVRMRDPDDGQEGWVDAINHQDALHSGLEIVGAPNTKSKDDEILPAPVMAAARGMAQGGTFGFGDELSAAAQAPFQTRDNETLVDTYKRLRDDQRARNEAAQEQYPVAYGTGEVVSQIPAFVGGVGAARPIFGDAINAGLSATKLGAKGTQEAAELVRAYPEGVIPLNELKAFAPNWEKMMHIEDVLSSAGAGATVGGGIGALNEAGKQHEFDPNAIAKQGAIGAATGGVGTAIGPAIRTLAPIAGDATGSVGRSLSKAADKVGYDTGGNTLATMMSKTIPLDLVGGHGLVTIGYLASKGLGKVLPSMAERVGNTSVLSNSSVSSTGGTLFTSLANYLSPKEKQKKAEDDFQNGNNNTYNKEE